MTIKLLKKIVVWLFFILIAIVYIKNLTRDVYGGDIGDLVTAAYVFGVAHPPGYPLFSLIGYLFSHLPLPLPIVSRVGLISVFSSLAGLVIYYQFSFKVTKSVFLSVLSTSILAFSYLFWLMAEIPESLGLNNFFVIIILYLSIMFYEKKQAGYLYFLAFFVGLSLTHQLFILTLFPAVFILILKHLKFIFSKRRFIFALLLLLAGLTVYVYIPIAASRNPPVNWDNAVNLKNFMRLILRKDYGGIIIPAKNIGLEIRLINVVHYIKTIVSVFSYQILLVFFLGTIKLFKIDKKLALTLFFAFILTGVIAFFLIAEPIFTAVAWGVLERYYGVSAIVLMFVVPYGFLLIKDFLDRKFSQPIYSYLLLSYFLIIPWLLLKYNFSKTNLSQTDIGNTLAKNILWSLPKNSVLFVSGDNTTFNIWYLYYVQKERPDIQIINPPGVGNDIYINKELNSYYQQNPKSPWNEIVTKTFVAIKKDRRMFSAHVLRPLPLGMMLLPKGLIFEIVDQKDIPSEERYLNEIEKIWKKMKIKYRKNLTPAEQNFIAPEIPFIYSRGLVRVGDFLTQYYHDPKKAEKFYQLATIVDEYNPDGYAGLAASLFDGYQNCDLAILNIQEAIFLYPIWSPYYLKQYNISQRCQATKKTLDHLRQEYKRRFGQEID